MHFMPRVFSNTTSPMTSVCIQYVGAMATRLYLSSYADKLLKGENQSNMASHVNSHAPVVTEFIVKNRKKSTL